METSPATTMHLVMENRTRIISSKRSRETFFTIDRMLPVDADEEYATERPQMEDQYRMIWVIKGAGTRWLDLHQTGILENTLYFIKPGQPFRIQADGNLEGYVLAFTGAFLDMEDPRSESTYYNSLFSLFEYSQGISIRSDIFPDLADITEKMWKESRNAHLFRTEILRRYLKIFLLYLTRVLEGRFQITGQSRNFEMVQKFMLLLDKKFKTNKMVSDYARDLVVTPNYLNEITKKITGHSAGYHIRQRVVLEAKRLGAYSDNGMKEIAYDLGFSDSSHFSKFFKTATGMNFTDFKKNRLIVLPAS